MGPQAGGQEPEVADAKGERARNRAVLGSVQRQKQRAQALENEGILVTVNQALRVASASKRERPVLLPRAL